MRLKNSLSAVVGSLLLFSTVPTWGAKRALRRVVPVQKPTKRINNPVVFVGVSLVHEQPAPKSKPRPLSPSPDELFTFPMERAAPPSALVATDGQLEKLRRALTQALKAQSKLNGYLAKNGFRVGIGTLKLKRGAKPVPLVFVHDSISMVPDINTLNQWLTQHPELANPSETIFIGASFVWPASLKFTFQPKPRVTSLKAATKPGETTYYDGKLWAWKPGWNDLVVVSTNCYELCDSIPERTKNLAVSDFVTSLVRRLSPPPIPSLQVAEAPSETAMSPEESMGYRLRPPSKHGDPDASETSPETPALTLSETFHVQLTNPPVKPRTLWQTLPPRKKRWVTAMTVITGVALATGASFAVAYTQTSGTGQQNRFFYPMGIGFSLGVLFGAGTLGMLFEKPNPGAVPEGFDPQK